MSQELADFIAMIAGAIVSFVLENVPGVSTWFESLSKIVKQLVVSGIMLAIAIVLFGLQCFGYLAVLFPQFGFTCDVAGALFVFQALVSAIGGAQVFHIVGNKGAIAFVKNLFS